MLMAALKNAQEHHQPIDRATFSALLRFDVLHGNMDLGNVSTLNPFGKAGQMIETPPYFTITPRSFEGKRADFSVGVGFSAMDAGSPYYTLFTVKEGVSEQIGGLAPFEGTPAQACVLGETKIDVYETLNAQVK